MKLHLGCGTKKLAGFVNCDIDPYVTPDLVVDISELPIENNSSELVYACHVLEHVERNSVKAVLQEWYRVLKPGGVLRISVPDFQKVAEFYLEGKESLAELYGFIYGGQRDCFDFHYVAFDEATLTQLLKQAGFSEVRHWDWRLTEHSAVDDYSQAYLPHMAKETGTLMSLNLEAVK